MTTILPAAIVLAFICCAFALVFAIAVALSSRRPYLVGAAVIVAFVAGVVGALTYPSRLQPSLIEMMDARLVCEANTGTDCKVQWRAYPAAPAIPTIDEQSEVASTR